VNVEGIRKEVAIALVGLLVGAWLGYALAYRIVRTNAIQQDCAYYDGKTGEFKWGPMQ